MKRIFTFIVSAFMALLTMAQAPQTISYQAVVRNVQGRLLRELPIGVRVTILSGKEDGEVVYTETRVATTTSNGLLTFAIGDDQAETVYRLADVDWSANTYFLRCEMDPEGGSAYSLSATSQMMSVPYALYAEKVSPNALPTWAQSDEKPTYTYQEIEGTPSIPTKVSELENDQKFITLKEVPEVVVPTKVSELENDADYAKKSDLPSTEGLLSEADAAKTYQPKGNYLTEHQSLTDYAKKSDLPSTEGLLSEADAKKTYQPKGNYLTEHQSLADYAKKSDLPSTEGLLSEADAKKTYQPKGNYLTEHQSLADYAKKSDLPSTEGLLSEADAKKTYQPKGNYLTEHQSLADYAKKSDLPSTEGLLSEADAKKTYQPKGNYLTEHQSLADYAKKSDLPTVPTKVSQMTNDAGYITMADVPDYVKQEEFVTILNNTKISELINDENYVKVSEVPTKVSELVNDRNYAQKSDLPVIPTKVSAFENDANYLTEHQSLAAYAKKSDLPTVPTKVSQLTNDAGYVTESNISTTLNTVNVSELVNDANYVTTADVPTKVSQLTNDKGYITAAEVPAVTVPTKVSAFENDANYLTEHQSLAAYAKKSDLPTVPTKVSQLTNDAGYVTESNINTTLNTVNVSELVNDANYVTMAEANAAYQPKGNYLTEHQSLAAYAKKNDLPTVPTKVSQLTNDAGYVTESNINTTLNTVNVSELVNDANYVTTADVPTKVSQLTNDKGYITAAEVPAVTVPTKVSAFENDANYLTEHQSLAAYAKKSDLPTVPTKVSQLTNDAGYVTESNISTTLNTVNVSELVNDANYVTATEANAAYQPKGNYLTEHQSLAAYAKKSDLPTVPTKVSQLTNDAGYVTESNISTTLNTVNVSELVNDANYVTATEANAAYQPKGNYLTEHQSLAAYAKKSELPTVPTKISAFTNDAGYITAAEVPAVSVPTKVSAFENDANYLTEHQSLADYAKKSELPKVPTKVSQLTNDANYAKKSDLPTVPTNVSAFTNDAGYITAADVPEVTVPTKVSQLTNDSKYITKSSIPTKVSAFTNDANYITKADIPTNVSEFVNDAEYAKKSDLPTVPTKVSKFENDAQYITKATFDGIVEDYNDLLGKYKNQLDSMRTVMEKDKKELDSMKSVVKNVTATSGGRTVAIDNGALPGAFSVSANKKVQFSMGNLQYQASSNTWRFAENQYDYVGENNANIASDYDGWIDLFAWGTSGWNSGANNYMPYSSEGDNKDYFVGGNGNNGFNGFSRNADWGVFNKISNGGNEPDMWRVLSQNEWKYLISERQNAANLKTRACVESINGFVFFPDDWVKPDGLPIKMGASDFSSNVWSLNRWNEIETSGAIFIPCGGYREGHEVGGIDEFGIYWTSTFMYFKESYTVSGAGIVGGSSGTRYYYFAYAMKNLSFPAASSSQSYMYGGLVEYKGSVKDGKRRDCGYSVRLVRSQLKTLKLSVANPNEGDVSSNGGAFERGDSIIVTARPTAGYYFKQWSDGNPNATRTIVVDADMSLTAYFAKKQTVSENGAFASLFSVSATKKVKFSQGNLQYQASTNTWRFAENQYDIVGTDNQNISESYDGWIDLFGWATSGWENQPYESSTTNSKYYVAGSSSKNMVGDYANADWGVYNAISNGGNSAGQWRTLTSSEWTYLYSGRTNAAKLRTKATVSGIAGFVFFPDTWTCPDDVTVALDQTNFTTNDFSPSVWETLENSGAVFLPAAGYRSGVSVSNVGTYGYYWSRNYNTSTTSNVNYFYFYGSSTTASSGGNRYYGRSVRLVQE